MNFFRNITRFIKPEQDLDLKAADSRYSETLPVLWLLGKTGAGKSSLIHAVTGNSRVEIGNGFSPCTRTSSSYDFPEDRPLMRFLDTRGLGEPDYDPGEDINSCQNRSHLLIVVMKAEEPDQSQVLNAIRLIKKTGRIEHILLVHTGVYLIALEQERMQCISLNQKQVEEAWGSPVESVSVDFELEDGTDFGVDELMNTLSRLMPIVAVFMDVKDHADQENANFARLKNEILWHAGVAGASDAVPVTGTVSVPAVQARMLYSIAGRYGLEWDKKAMAQFAGAMGAAFGAQYAARLGIRQVVKLIPVYGQTVGSATAAAVSFCSTYALGRAACKYIYHKSRGESVNREELINIYKKAFAGIRETAGNEKSKR